jgi:hypothetical protein
MKVFYTANDYVGKDTLDLEVFFPNSNARKVTYSIAVKR